jgi:hypothetical protein
MESMNPQMNPQTIYQPKNENVIERSEMITPLPRSSLEMQLQVNPYYQNQHQHQMQGNLHSPAQEMAQISQMEWLNSQNRNEHDGWQIQKGPVDFSMPDQSAHGQRMCTVDNSQNDGKYANSYRGTADYEYGLKAHEIRNANMLFSTPELIVENSVERESFQEKRARAISTEDSQKFKPEKYVESSGYESTTLEPVFVRKEEPNSNQKVEKKNPTKDAPRPVKGPKNLNYEYELNSTPAPISDPTPEPVAISHDNQWFEPRHEEISKLQQFKTPEP